MKNSIILLNLICTLLFGKVRLGVDLFFEDGHYMPYREKRLGLVTNHTGVNGQMTPTYQLFYEKKLHLKAIFSPEHGFRGQAVAFESVEHGQLGSIPVYSLMGETRRPTEHMLKEVDVLIYDIQDIGVRPYTYATTLFYVMEEAAKYGKTVVVLDRPNPLGGKMIDGPMMEEKWRSFIGYINVPYCHGMTIGELARFFNDEYQVGCQLRVIHMQGWERTMSFTDTGLMWIPTSPHIPEADTPLYFAATGLLGELEVVNIGVGYTLPFKVVGAPWIDADTFAKKLNEQKLQGVKFVPFTYRPFYGSFRGSDCHGVLIQATDRECFEPLKVQFALLGILKSLYPKQIATALGKANRVKRDLFCKASGTDEIFNLLKDEKFITWKLFGFHADKRTEFMKKRQKYLKY